MTSDDKRQPEQRGVTDLDCFPDAMLRVATDNSIIDANQSAETLFNRSRHAMTGRPADAVVDFAESGGINRLLDASVEQAWAYAVSLPGPVGEAPVADIGIGPPGVGGTRIISIHVIPGGRVAAQRREGGGAQSAGAIAQMLAHEIKNPLSGIRGAAQLLGKGADARGQGMSRLIVGEVDRIAKLVDGMQGFSRGMPLPMASLNIYPAIAQAREVAIRGFAGRAKIIEEFDPSLPRVSANHDALVQVLLNLVRNAVDAAPSAADCCIRLTTKYRYGLAREVGAAHGAPKLPVEIIVADDGPGVPEALTHALFDPFVTTKPDGQGLGLALVEKLVRDMGGSVHHERRGGWTRFVIRLAAATGASA